MKKIMTSKELKTHNITTIDGVLKYIDILLCCYGLELITGYDKKGLASLEIAPEGIKK